jgi:hypothetical protein
MVRSRKEAAGMTTALEQNLAMTIAHRLVLTYLVMAVRKIPGEEGREAMDNTNTMLRNSIPGLMAGVPEPTAGLMAALVETEIDRIFLARVQNTPPPAD